MLGEIAWSQTNCPGSLWNDLACHRGKVVKIEKVFTSDSSNYCRKRHLLVYGLWKLPPSELKITKISTCQAPHMQLFCPALSQGINQPGERLTLSSLRGFMENTDKYWCWRTPLIGMLPPHAPETREREAEISGEAREKRCCRSVCPAVLPRCLLLSGDFSWGLSTGKPPAAPIAEPEGPGGYLQEPDQGYPGQAPVWELWLSVGHLGYWPGAGSQMRDPWVQSLRYEALTFLWLVEVSRISWLLS